MAIKSTPTYEAPCIPADPKLREPGCVAAPGRSTSETAMCANTESTECKESRITWMRARLHQHGPAMPDANCTAG
eukprot:396451-Prorocentrum_minimum.AAC.2